jgi:lipid A ethanolaminephosphotransferase
VLAAALAWPYKRGLRAAYSLAPIGALVLVTAHLSAWGMVIEGYPSPFAVPARLVYVLSDTSTIADLPLKPVPAGHVSPSPFTHIVFIVDESIRGDYLTINDPRIDTTPFLEQSADRLINFGIATSGSNCSHESRWLLRRGVRPWQMPEASTPSRRVDEGIVDGPRTTLFQFAKAAGFNVVYVDAWTSLLGAFRDGTTAEELTFVDERLTLESDAQSRRDLAAARALVSVLKRPGPTFVQVDKLGAHLPYDEFTPEDFNRYTRRDGARFLYKRNNREDQVGSYKNAVAWSVDEFFRAVLPNVDLRETLILYTSDHGENLGDGGYMWGHCSIDNVHPSEEWVPLFALTGSAAFGQALSASARTSFSDATHFEIVPTLLRAMGYDPAWVSDVYGPSLLEIPRGRPRRFLVGDVLFSKQRTWSTVAPWTPPPSATSSDRR